MVPFTQRKLNSAGPVSFQSESQKGEMEASRDGMFPGTALDEEKEMKEE